MRCALTRMSKQHKTVSNLKLLCSCDFILIMNNILTETISLDSIVIKNPPSDATDPKEWKSFFETKFGPDVHVTCCTVARDNYQLVQALVARREILQRLKWRLPPGSRLDIGSLAIMANDIKVDRGIFDNIKAVVVSDIPELFKQLIVINERIKKLSLIDYQATRVFVTFETEKAQRTVLNSLSVGTKMVLKRSKFDVANSDHLFRSRDILHVNEAHEPSSIRWHDLSDRPWERTMKYVLTTYAWACGMYLVIMVVRLCHQRSAKFAAYAVAVCNGVSVQFH